MKLKTFNEFIEEETNDVSNNDPERSNKNLKAFY